MGSQGTEGSGTGSEVGAAVAWRRRRVRACMCAGYTSAKTHAVRPVDIFKTFTIESAHRLPRVPEGHKCARLHGHSFRIEVHVSGAVSEREGWVMDFADISRAFKPLFEQLDHRYLNEVDGLENPTSENLARWVWARLKPQLPGLSRVVIHETCTAGCSYSGD